MGEKFNCAFVESPVSAKWAKRTEQVVQISREGRGRGDGATYQANERSRQRIREELVPGHGVELQLRLLHRTSDPTVRQHERDVGATATAAAAAAAATATENFVRDVEQPGTVEV